MSISFGTKCQGIQHVHDDAMYAKLEFDHVTTLVSSTIYLLRRSINVDP